MGRVLPKLCPSEAVLRDVLGRTWKGNGCELRTFLEEAVVLIEGGILNVAEASRCERGGSSRRRVLSLHAMVEDAERRHIRSALERTGGSVMKTRKLLGISRRTLWEKLKKTVDGQRVC